MGPPSSWPARVGGPFGEPVVVGCRAGARSALAAEVLINAGFTEVKSVEGGIRAWVAAGCQSSHAFAAHRKLVWDFPRRARSPIVGTLGTDSGRLERSKLYTVLAWGKLFIFQRQPEGA